MRPGMQAGGDEPAASGANASSSSCPLCEGRESETPPEVYAIRASGVPDSPGWIVRAVPNKYPLLAPERGVEAVDPLEHGRGEPELLASGSASGAHEVIVHAPKHHLSLADLEPDQFSVAIEAWRARISAHDDAPYVHLSVNEGRRAGASLEHTHAQLYALPFVPALVARERERFTAYSDRTQGRNLLEDVIQEEVRRRERIVAIDDEAVAVAPFAARVPFHVVLAPRRPAARFADDGPLGGRLLHQVLNRLGAALGTLPPLNMWVRTAPRDAAHFCWRIEIMPRLAQLAGLEIGTGVHLNVLAPEDAAQRLRDAEQ